MFNFRIPIDTLRWVDLIDIFIVFILVYYAYKAVSKTKALPILHGAVIIFITMFIAAYFEFNTLQSILQRIITPMILSVFILFPSEMRRGLYMIGKRTFFIKRILNQTDKATQAITEAVDYLSKHRVGSLIILQRNDSLQDIIDTGTELQANINADLIIALFQKKSPLHDGAIIIGQNHIIAAACYITNLSNSREIDARYGTRHRAGLGVSEFTDAITIITSEERGKISLAYNSNIYLDVSLSKLKELLTRFTRTRKNAR